MVDARHAPARRPAEGVAHEGYGGWTWQRFVPLRAQTGRHLPQTQQPIRFLNADGKAEAGCQAVLDEDVRPASRLLVFMLGINDCFSADPMTRPPSTRGSTAMFGHADTLLAAFRRPRRRPSWHLPDHAPQLSAEAFEANYKGRYHSLGLEADPASARRRQIEHFRRENEPDHMVPTELNLDPWMATRSTTASIPTGRLPADRCEHLRLAQMAIQSC